MENKYFTPDIEDIRVGYEWEWNLGTEEKPRWTKYTISTNLIPADHRPNPDWALIKDFLSLGKIRVPYLTKEQIEAEGWIKRTTWFDDTEKQRLGWRPDYEFTTEFGSLRLYIRDLENPWKHISIEKYTKSGPEPLSMASFEPVYRGQCKDINTFRYICKLLGI